MPTKKTTPKNIKRHRRYVKKAVKDNVDDSTCLDVKRDISIGADVDSVDVERSSEEPIIIEGNDKGSFALKNIQLSPDWVKITIAIIAQSVAIGFYISAIKSELGYLTRDVSEMKKQLETTVSVSYDVLQIKEQLKERKVLIEDIKKSVDSVSDKQRDAVQADSDLSHDLKGLESKFAEEIKRIRDEMSSLKEADKIYHHLHDGRGNVVPGSGYQVHNK